MTLIQKLIILSATMTTSMVLHADNGRLTFPPENALGNAAGKGYVFPPQRPSRPLLNQRPQTPQFNANHSFPQQPMPYPSRPASVNRYPTQPAFSNRQYPPQYQQRGQQAKYPATPSRPAPRAMQKQYPSYPTYSRRNNNRFPFSNNMPFGNSSNNSFFPFSNGNMPFSNGNSFGMPNNPMNNMFGNRNNRNMPFFNQGNKKRKKAWGTERNIWPDFYTDFTDDAWDTVTKGPRDLGKMPGGWRFPYISTPDPVTVSDAIANQFPPIAEEAGNMADFSDWGVFDNKK